MPLIEPAYLMRLNGNDYWIFSPSRFGFKGTDGSALMNIQQIGMAANGYILINDAFEDGDFKYYSQNKRAILVKRSGNSFEYTYFETKHAADSLYNSEKKNYTWYNIDSAWDDLIEKNCVPWCKQGCK